jgi:hypothetical protein
MTRLGVRLEMSVCMGLHRCFGLNRDGEKVLMCGTSQHLYILRPTDSPFRMKEENSEWAS